MMKLLAKVVLLVALLMALEIGIRPAVAAPSCMCMFKGACLYSETTGQCVSINCLGFCMQMHP